MGTFQKRNADKIGLSNDFLARICAAISQSAPIEQIHVFGSYARGEQSSKSDLDLYVVYDDGVENVIGALGDSGSMVLPLFKEARLEYDLVGNTRSAFASQISDRGILPHRIVDEGVMIYG